MACIDIENGKRKWRKRGYGYGQVLLVGDVMLIQAEDGRVALVEAIPNKPTELASFQAIDGKTWNYPTLYGDLLLVRNGTEAACYKLPTIEQSSVSGR